MTVACFTSFSFSYLAKARVLAESVKLHNPAWQTIALISDRPPDGMEFDGAPFDRIVYLEDLEIANVLSWAFQHDVIELCTAVKGPFLKQLLDEGADKVVYLDPDTVVFGSMSPIESLLDLYSIIVTPHQLQPESEPQAILDNEVTALNFGVYNLGFLAVRNNGIGRALSAWWSARLIENCFDDREHGIFVDQKWFDLVPAMFENVHILRDPGYNVASWNLSNRHIDIRADGTIEVNGSPLRFYHFTKLGPVGDLMTARYARDNIDVYELWGWYRRKVAEKTDLLVRSDWWAYGRFSDGAPITPDMRRAYRSRPDMIASFPDPFRSGPDGFQARWREIPSRS